jgi:hypothetical protein
MIELNEGPGMQQGGTITFEPVVQTSTLKTWQILVAVFLFACVIYGVVWWARRRSENNAGSLHFRGDHPADDRN